MYKILYDINKYEILLITRTVMNWNILSLFKKKIPTR